MKSRDALVALVIIMLAGIVNAVDPCEDPCLTIDCDPGEMCVSFVTNCNDLPCPRAGYCIPDGVATTGNNYEDKRMCKAWGDPHYKTFDGDWIDYMGTNTYIMAELKLACRFNPNMQDFLVVVDHEERNGNVGVSYVNWIELIIFWPDGTETSVMIEESNIITVNNNPIPYVNGDPLPAGIASIDINTGVVETDFGVVVMYDGLSTAKIWIPVTYGGCVEGLCGNADGVENEFVNRPGVNCALKPWNEKHWCVGNSWIYTKGGPPATPDPTVDPFGRRCTPNDDVLCDAMRSTTGPFQTCLAKMNSRVAEGFYSGCVFDVCAAPSNKKTEVACVAMEAFAEECKGLVSDSVWRKDTGCIAKPRCLGDQVLPTRRRRCYDAVTCAKPDPTWECQDGCQCPRGTYEHGIRCLTERECTARGLWRNES